MSLFGLIGPPDIDKLLSKKDIKRLILALRYKANSADQEAQKLRTKAAAALGVLGDARAVDALLLMLDEKDKEIVLTVVESLGRIGDKRAVAPLVRMLRNQDLFLRKKAAEALQKLAWQPAGREAGWYWVALLNWKKCIELGSDAVEALMSAIWDANSLVKIPAIETLGTIGDPQPVDYLASFLKENKYGGQKANDEVLQFLGKAMMEKTLAFLKTDEQNIRVASAEALGKIGGEKAIQALTSALKEDDVLVRIACVKALKNTRDPHAVKPLASVLDDRNEKVCDAAYDALANFGSASVVEPLIQKLNDQSPKVRMKAVEALEKIKDPRIVGALINKLKDPDSEVCIKVIAALGNTNDPRTLAALLEMLKEGNENIRSAAVKTLGKNSDPRVAAHLEGALFDRNDIVRMDAADVLSRINQPRVIELLIPQLRDQDPGIRNSSANSLKRMAWQPSGEDEGWYWAALMDWERCLSLGLCTVEPLNNAFKHHDPRIRLEVLKTLIQMKSPTLRENLAVALKDNDLFVRQTAKRTLKQLEMGSARCETGHDWDGCICRICGETRDEEHSEHWIQDGDFYCFCPKCDLVKGHDNLVISSWHSDTRFTCKRCGHTSVSEYNDW
jgi:HEAT repeat protein